jgi:hypothetical protein
VVWSVAAISSVPELRANEALLVFWPSDLLLGVFGDEWRRRYAKLRLSVLLVTSALSVVGALRQPLLLWVLAALPPFLIVLLAAQEARASSTTAATA